MNTSVVVVVVVELVHRMFYTLIGQTQTVCYKMEHGSNYLKVVVVVMIIQMVDPYGEVVVAVRILEVMGVVLTCLNIQMVMQCIHIVVELVDYIVVELVVCIDIAVEVAEALVVVVVMIDNMN